MNFLVKFGINLIAKILNNYGKFCIFAIESTKMQEKSKGIVLFQIKYSDTSNIVNIYTEKFGKIAFLVRNGKKKSASKSALFQPLTILDIDFSYSSKKELQYIKESRVVFPFNSIPYEPVKSSLVMFLAEILQKTLRHSETDKMLYDFLESSILELDNCSTGLGNFHICFLIKLSEHLGFSPNEENMEQARYFDLQNGVFERYKPLSGIFLQNEDLEHFKKIINIEYNSLSSLQLSKNNRAKMLDILTDYYKLHLPDFQPIRSLEVLRSLWD